MCIDWDSSASEILLNPRLQTSESGRIQYTVQQFSHLTGHVWMATSGSSGHRKLVALSKKAILASAAAVNQHLEVCSGDSWIQALPSFHVGGLAIWARASLSPISVRDYYSENRWNPQTFREAAQESKATLTALVPTQVYDLIECHLKAPSSLRAIVVGGGALSLSLYQKGRALGWNLLPSYGSTECASQVATASLDSLQSEENPELPPMRLLPHWEAFIDSDGRICLKGPALLTGYLEEEHSQFIDPKKEGWFQTEDVGKMIDQIYLEVYGRKTDFIKIGGESVDKIRLERILDHIKEKIQFRNEAILISVPDERLGVSLHLAVVKEGVISGGEEGKVGGEEVDSLLAAFQAQVLPFERIRKVHLLKRIPRTELGKVDRKALLEAMEK